MIGGGLYEGFRKWEFNRTFMAYAIVETILVILLFPIYGTLSFIAYLAFTVMIPLFRDTARFWNMNRLNKDCKFKWNSKTILSKSQSIDFKTKVVMALVLGTMLSALMITL
jgi:hypothetical protein